MTSSKKLFISYSHADESFVTELAEAMLQQGQDVWVAKWDIRPGDSLVDKIFEDGLRDAVGVAVVLSKASVRSAWVREELNVALLRRIEEKTRVIPILLENVEVPTALRHLLWVDMRTGIESGVRSILNTLHGYSEKPAVGELPPHLKTLAEPVSGLSRAATAVGYYLLRSWPLDESFPRGTLNETLANDLKLSPEEVNDAVDELESQGLAEVNQELGTAPYSFRFVEPTYLLHHAFAAALPYNPQEDVSVVLAALSALGKAHGAELHQHTGLSYGRLNRAVDYIKDQGFADVILTLGTAPFSFYEASATRVTRQMAQAGPQAAT